MTLCFELYRRNRNTMRLAALVLIVCGAAAGSFGRAQQPTAPRTEIFAGYSAYFPGTTASGLLPLGLTPISSCLCWNPRGAGAGVTVNFNRWLGVTADMSGHWGNGATTTAGRLGQFSAYNISAGPKFTLRRGRFAPFGEVLFGGDRLSPELFGRDDRFGLLAGGGLDFHVGHHLAIRPVQADFVYSNHQFGSQPLVPPTDVRGVRLQAGLVFFFGGHAVLPPPVQASTAVAPVAAPAPVPQPVDQLTLVLSASPSSISPGDSSTISAAGTSSLNRPLTYSFSASSGAITGTAATAVLSTEGVAAGNIMVTGNVVDDTGQSATATTTVQVMAATAAVVTEVETHPLGSISFARDVRRPSRVDNEAKAFLDGVALSMQHDPDAKLALIGSAGTGERNGADLAAQRAVNTKDYLVSEKGIDASRIMVFTGPADASADAKKVTFIEVPAGAKLDTAELIPVDASVQPHPRNSARPHSKSQSQ